MADSVNNFVYIDNSSLNAFSIVDWICS